jgi:TonB family protein
VVGCATGEDGLIIRRSDRRTAINAAKARLLSALWLLLSTPAMGQDLASWLKQIEQKVQTHFSLQPDADADSGATLQVWLLESGYAWAMHTLESTRHESYNLAARRAVLAASPLPLPSDSNLLLQMRVVTFAFRGRSVRLANAERARAPSPPSGGSTSDASASDSWPRCSSDPASGTEQFTCDAPESKSSLEYCFGLAWQRRVASIVQRCGDAAYPANARLQQWHGIAEVQLQFTKAGALESATVARSSGHDVLDERAVELARMANLDVPVALRGQRFQVRLPMVFKLRAPTCPADGPARCQLLYTPLLHATPLHAPRKLQAPSLP